jgi:hypothetical protein
MVSEASMKRLLTLCFVLGLTTTSVRGQFSLPYFNDFETDTAGWTVETLGGSPWIYSNVTSVFCPGYSFQLAPVTGLNTSSILVSPVFNLNGETHPQICLSHKRTLNVSQDGMRIEYNLNGTGIWQVLGDTSSSGSWYECPVLQSSGLPGWCGISGPTCSNSSMSLAFLAGNSTVQFRFVPTSMNGNIGLYYLASFTLCDSFCPCSMTGVGLNEPESATNPLIFAPNPSTGNTTVEIFSGIHETVLLTLYNLVGAIVWQQEMQIAAGKNEVHLDLATIPAGLYVATLQRETELLFTKIVKE